MRGRPAPSARRLPVSALRESRWLAIGSRAARSRACGFAHEVGERRPRACVCGCPLRLCASAAV